MSYTNQTATQGGPCVNDEPKNGPMYSPQYITPRLPRAANDGGPRESGSVMAAVKRAINTLDVLDTIEKEMHARLRMVTASTPSPERDNHKEARPVGCELAGVIHELADRLESHAASLFRMKEQIDI